MFLLKGLYRAARALKQGEDPVRMSARVCSARPASEEVTVLVSQCTSETREKHEYRVKQRNAGSTGCQLAGKDPLSEQDRLIHSLHQDACKVSTKSLLYILQHSDPLMMSHQRFV